MRRSRHPLALALAASSAAACGNGKANSTAAPALARQPRQGDWHLVGFAPSLEPPLRALFGAQLQTLSINFDDDQVQRDRTWVEISGRHDMASASGDSLTVASSIAQVPATASPACSSVRNFSSPAPTRCGPPAGVPERVK